MSPKADFTSWKCAASAPSLLSSANLTVLALGSVLWKSSELQEQEGGTKAPGPAPPRGRARRSTQSHWSSLSPGCNSPPTFNQTTTLQRGLQKNWKWPKVPAHIVPNLHNFKIATSHDSPLWLISNCSCSTRDNINPERFRRLRCAPAGGKKVQGEKAGLQASSLFEAESSTLPARMETRWGQWLTHVSI